MNIIRKEGIKDAKKEEHKEKRWLRDNGTENKVLKY